MKKNLQRLYELYAEEICMSEEENSENDIKNSLLERLDKCRDVIAECSEEDIKALLAELEHIYLDLIDYEKKASFINGFSISAKLITEALK